MSADVKWLKKKYGICSEQYRKIFSQQPHTYPRPIKKLVDIIRSDIEDGRTNNLSDWPAIHAVDCAYQTPFNQRTATLVRDIVGRRLDEASTLEALKGYGLDPSELFIKVKGQDGQDHMQPNIPVLFEVFIPIVIAYVDTVLSQLFNERNTSPLLPYRPAKETTRNRILCEIWTDIAQTMSGWYGYPQVLEQSMLQMLKYGVCLTFPQEEWHSEYQVHDYGDGPQKILVKEGIRYRHPHPTQMAYDPQYPLHSLNTDTGTQWLFDWTVTNYGQIFDNKKYWNRTAIFSGRDWFSSPNAGPYFDEIYPCRFKFPAELRGVGFTRELLREDRAAWLQSSSQRNQAVFVTEYYRKIIPAAFGLGQYKFPVWHHFTVAGDDTIIWAEPCAYTPAFFMGYNYDQQAARNPSLALDLIPWQDTLGNILSQSILTGKNNLLNVNMYDVAQVDKNDVLAWRNLGESKYRMPHWMGFDSTAKRAQNLNPANAVIPVNTRYTSINELLQLFPQVLNIMERVLGIAAQEAGGSASHQQSKAEVIETTSAGKLRRARTGSSVDAGIDAMKRQVRDGFTAYGDPEVSAEVSADIEDLDKHLEDMGLTKVSTEKEKVIVKGHKKVIRLEAFAATNQGPLAPNEKEVAQALMSGVQTVIGQEPLFSEVGVEACLDIIEQAVRLAGGPKDFKLVSKSQKDKGQIPPAVKEALIELGKEILQQAEQKIGQPAAQEFAKVQQEVTGLQDVVKKLSKIYEVAGAAQEKANVAKAEAEQRMDLAQKTFEADERRKQEKHQLDMHRDVEKANVTREVALETAKTKTHLAHADAAAKAEPDEQPKPHKVAESISYKDLPEELKPQVEQQAGLKPVKTRTYRKAEKPAASK